MDFLTVITNSVAYYFGWILHPFTWILLSPVFIAILGSVPVLAEIERESVIQSRLSVDQFISWWSQEQARKMGFGLDQSEVIKRTEQIVYLDAGRTFARYDYSFYKKQTVILVNRKGQYLFYASGLANPIVKILPSGTARFLLGAKYRPPATGQMD